MTVREHLTNFLDWHYTNKKQFKTHHIQNLSQRGLKKYGRILGSPETYTRQFRDLRQHNLYYVDKIHTYGKSEKSWYVRSKDD